MPFSTRQTSNSLTRKIYLDITFDTVGDYVIRIQNPGSSWRFSLFAASVDQGTHIVEEVDLPVDRELIMNITSTASTIISGKAFFSYLYESPVAALAILNKSTQPTIFKTEVRSTQEVMLGFAKKQTDLTALTAFICSGSAKIVIDGD